MPYYSKKKVLHVTPFYPPDKGGISNVVKNLSEALKDYNNDIDIITASKLKNDNRELYNTKIKVTKIKSFYLLGWPYSTLRSFSIPLDLGFRINNIIKNGHYDIVHVHGHHYPISWMAIKSAFKNNIPTVLSIHGMYGLNPNVLGGKTRTEDLFNKIVFKKVLSKCTVVVGGTMQITSYAKKYGKSSSKFLTIANGVFTNNFKNNIDKKKQYRTKYNLKIENIVVLFVGRFEEVKGIIEFSKAAKTLALSSRKIEIVIVGDGKLLHQIRAIVGNESNIKILGWLPQDKIHEIYIASDIFVLSSKFEALPLTILEAMNANLHIVYTNVGGVDEILGGYHKKTLLHRVTSEDIVNSVTHVLSNPFSNTTDSNSSEYAKSFDWTYIAKEINQIYEEIKKK